MAARNPFNMPDLRQYAQRRGMATPTQSFVQPSQDRELQGLVQGLAALQPSLNRFSQQYLQQTAQERQAEGVEAARVLVREGLSLAEATREGRLPQQANPWFMAGFHEKMGQAAADRWHTQLIEDMAKDPDLQVSTSTGDAEEFINRHRENWMANNTPNGLEDNFFSQGFGSRADARTQDEMVKFASRIEGRLTKQSSDTHFAQVKQHVEKEFFKGTSPEEIALGLSILVQTQYSLGTKEKTIDEATTNAIIAAGMDIGEEKILEVLRHTRTSRSDDILANTASGSEAFIKARKDIRDMVWNQNQRDWTMKERADAERLNGVLTDAMMAKAQDANFDLKSFIPKLKDQPEALAKLSMMENQMNVLNNRTDESVRRDLFTGIFVYETPEGQTTEEDVALARAQNQLTTEDAASLIAQIRSARSSGKENEQGIWGDFQFRQTLNSIGPQFRNRLGEFENDKSAASASFAEAMLMERWWNVNAGGGVPPEKRAQWLIDNAQDVINIAKGPDELTIKPRPLPQFQNTPSDLEAKLPKTLVLEPADLDAQRRGITTESMKRRLDELGLRTPSERGAFLKSQLRLYIQQHGRPAPSMGGGQPTTE